MSVPTRGCRISKRGWLRRDDGSIALAMLVMIAVSGIAALLTPMFLLQVQTGRTDTARAVQLSAARSGLDIGVGHIRAATATGGGGALSLLPCVPLTGATSAVTIGTGGTYSVAIRYYDADPTNFTPTQLATSPSLIKCISGFGTAKTPSYAELVSQGTDVSTGGFPANRTRQLRGIYVFQTTNQNIPGGAIHAFKTGASSDLCFDAGSALPAAGTNLTMQPCVPTLPDRQKFAYATNLNIVLTASKTTAQPLGMCLDAPFPHVDSTLITFQPCSSSTLPRQQWSQDDNADFRGTTDGSTLDSFCFAVSSPDVAGSTVKLTNAGCDGSAQSNQYSFSPDAAAGAGMAGPNTGQLVNFKQFGRCLDVTNAQVSSAFLIAWPCKQTPSLTGVLWNQKWTLPVVTSPATSAVGAVYTSQNNTTPYCLVSPLSTASGSYVTVATCSPSGSLPTGATWTRYGKTSLYSTSYSITDSLGECLQPTDPTATPPDFYANGYQVSKLIVATCNGSTLQKWNADPTVVLATPLVDVGER